MSRVKYMRRRNGLIALLGAAQGLEPILFTQYQWLYTVDAGIEKPYSRMLSKNQYPVSQLWLLAFFSMSWMPLLTVKKYFLVLLTGMRLTAKGMILFPLDKQLFSELGSAGISMFYVSTIVSQVTFSSGSIFRGAIGSELVC